MRFTLRVSAFVVTPLLTLALLALPLAAQEDKQDRPQAKPTPSATANAPSRPTPQAKGNAVGTHTNSSAKPNAQPNRGIIDIDIYAPKPKVPGVGNQVTGNSKSNAMIGNSGRRTQLNAARPQANQNAKGIIDVPERHPSGANAPKPRTPGVGVGTSNQVTGNTVSNANIGNTGRQAQLNAARPQASRSAKGIIDIDTNAPKPQAAPTGNQVTGNAVSNANIGDSGRQTRSNTRGSNKTNAQVKGNAAGTQTKGNAKPITGDAGKQTTGTAAHTQPKSTTAAPK